MLTSAITSNFDAQLDYVLTAMIASAEIGPDGEVLFNRAAADQRFLEPYSGLYCQISGDGLRALPVALAVGPAAQVGRDAQRPRGPCLRQRRIRRRAAADARARRPAAGLAGALALPGRAEPRRLDEQISVLRRTMIRSFGILGLGLIVLAALQAFYGLWPLRRVRRAIAAIRSGQKSRIEERLPREIEPLTEELNALLEHNETQAEEARRHAGNLAHALKTPLTVITNAATAQGRRSRRHGDPRGDDDAPPGRPPSRPRPRDRPPLQRPGARRRSGRRSRRSSARSARLYENVTVDLAGDKQAGGRGSSGRISTRCSAI